MPPFFSCARRRVDLDRTRELLRRVGSEHAPEVLGELLAEAAREELEVPRVIERVCGSHGRLRCVILGTMKQRSGAGRFLMVRCGEQRILLPAESVVRILGSVALTPIPGAAPEVLGLAQVEGEPLAVLDLGRIVGEVPMAGSMAPVVVEARSGFGNEVLGLAVEEAVRLLEVEPESLSEAPPGLPASEAVVVDGVGAVILDLARLAEGTA